MTGWFSFPLTTPKIISEDPSERGRVTLQKHLLAPSHHHPVPVTSDTVKVVFHSAKSSHVRCFLILQCCKNKMNEQEPNVVYHEGALGFKSQEMMPKLGFTLGKPVQLV